ncbi:MAG TPA: hypothetical protein VKT72_05010 [Candidatus Baltobacteraceae bacterium]|nr:hypothetical protein [Candidatus Baltobacteraceae bacterium]
MTLALANLRRAGFVMLTALVLLGSSALRGAADQRDFTVYNETSFTIDSLYVSPHSSDNWEEDVLGNDVLEPGHHVKIMFSDDLGYCYYDIKAIYSDGTDSEKYNVDLCSISTFHFHE